MDIYRSELCPKFEELFLQTMAFTEEEFEQLLQLFRREFVPKKYFYLKAGQVTRQKAYINKGCTRSFVVDEKGGEHILFFGFEDWWIGDFESYHTGQPGKQFVQAMEDCELLCISKKDFDFAMLQNPKMQKWYEVKQQKMFYATMDRLHEVKTLSPEQRYLNLLQKHPQIFQRIPLQHIASYLDIEPPSLSRMRKRLYSK